MLLTHRHVALAAICGAAILAVLSFAERASADFGFISSDIKLRQKQGPDVKLGTSSSEGRGIAIINAKASGADAEYSTRLDAATARHFAADFKQVGEFNLRFKTRKRTEPSASRFCGGPGKAVRRTGVFKGRLRLRGEGGYIGISKHRAAGKVLKVRCFTSDRAQDAADSRREARRGSRPPVKLLTCGPKRSVIDELLITKSGASSRPRFFAEMHDRIHGSVHTSKSVQVVGGTDRFTYTADLSEATIKAPRRFDGSATYTGTGSHNATSGPLSGDLAVDFLGTSNVALTPSRADLRRTNSDGACF
jgi:hypothetical protein